MGPTCWKAEHIKLSLSTLVRESEGSELITVYSDCCLISAKIYTTSLMHRLIHLQQTRHNSKFHWWVSEWILNGTSAQLGYTVPFTLVHTGKYRTEDKLKIQILHKLNTTQKKQTTQNKTTLVQWLRKWGGPILQCYQATWGPYGVWHRRIMCVKFIPHVSSSNLLYCLTAVLQCSFISSELFF